MCPRPSSMCGRQSRVMRVSPSTLVSSMTRSSSSSASRIVLRPRASPALFTSKSSRPSRLDASATNFLQLSASVTSSGAKKWSSPGSSATSSSIRSTRRAPSASRAPAPARARAVAAPIPLEAPVTTAVLPSSSGTRRSLSSPPGYPRSLTASSTVMPSSRRASDLHPCSFPEELSQEYAKAAAAHCPAPTGRILRIGPVSPRERVRKALAGVRIVREARLLVAEVGAAEPRSEKRPGAVVEREIPDLVRVFVLDDRPGVRAAVGCRRQQRLVEDDEAGARARAAAVRDPNRHRGRNEAPVERTRLERRSYLRPRRLAPARENVRPAAGLSLRGHEERREREQQIEERDRITQRPHRPRGRRRGPPAPRAPRAHRDGSLVHT